jgi:putative redox protein
LQRLPPPALVYDVPSIGRPSRPGLIKFSKFWESWPMPTVNLTRLSQHHFEAANARGGSLSFGRKWAGEFTPVELLLVAIAGCTSMDVDAITVKRSEPTRFNVSCSGHSTKSEHGNHVTDIQVHFDVEFPDSEEGRAAIAVLDKAIRKSHDRLCTVTRTVELGTPVDALLHGKSVLTAGSPV